MPLFWPGDPSVFFPSLSSLCQPEAIQTLYMRVLYLVYRIRPDYHSMVSGILIHQNFNTTLWGRHRAVGLHLFSVLYRHQSPFDVNIWGFIATNTDMGKMALNLISYLFFFSGSPFSEHSVSGLSWEVIVHPQCLRPYVSPPVFKFLSHICILISCLPLIHVLRSLISKTPNFI